MPDRGDGFLTAKKKWINNVAVCFVYTNNGIPPLQARPNNGYAVTSIVSRTTGARSAIELRSEADMGTDDLPLQKLVSYAAFLSPSLRQKGVIEGEREVKREERMEGGWEEEPE